MKIFKYVLILLFCLISRVVFATNYCVTQTGSGTCGGLSADMSVATFNAITGDKSDNTYFFDDSAGTITTKIEIHMTGTSGHPVIIDGYQPGDTDHMAGVDNNATKITVSSDYGIQLIPNSNDITYVTIKDFRIQDQDEAGIRGYATSSQEISHIIIEQNTIENISQSDGIHFNPTSGFTRDITYWLTIQDNYLHNCNYLGVGSAASFIRLLNTDDTVIQRNVFITDPGYSKIGGADGIVVLTSDKILIQNNYMKRFGENCIDYKDDSDGVFGNSIIRFNYCADSHEFGIVLQDIFLHNVYFYGNMIDGSVGEGIDSGGLGFYRGTEDSAAWANVIHNVDKGGIHIQKDEDIPAGSRDCGNILVSNNTLAFSAQSTTDNTHGGLEIHNVKSDKVVLSKNNIFYNDGTSNYRTTLYTANGMGLLITTSDGNLFYDTRGTPTAYWDNVVANILTPWQTLSSQDSNSLWDNPDFLNPLNYNFGLSTGSPAISSGVTVSNPAWWSVPTIQGVSYSSEVALNLLIDPDNTNFTAKPPVVTMTSQTSPWTMGAYAYTRQDYYIREDGTAANKAAATGCGAASTAMSVATHNSETFSPGDFIYVCDEGGNITSEIIIPSDGSAAGGYITYDGLPSGDYDALGEGSDGQAVINRGSQSSGIVGIRYDSRDYIIIQDFEITNAESGIYALYTTSKSNIIIRRNFIHDGSGSGIYCYNVDTFTIGGSLGNGNVVKDWGDDTSGVDINIAGSTSHDWIVSYNHLYATKNTGASTDRGIDGIIVNHQANTGLIEYNSIHSHNDSYGDTGEDGIDIKNDEAGTFADIIVRYNHIYDHTYANGINFGDGRSRIYVYGNSIHDNENGIITYDSSGRIADNIYVFSNLIYDNEEVGLSFSIINNAHSWNNTFKKNGWCADNPGGTCRDASDSAWTHFKTSGVYASVNMKNSILYSARIYATAHQYEQIYIGPNEDTLLASDYNIYYWNVGGVQTSKMYWGDAGSLTLAQVQADPSPPPTANSDDNSTDEDPDLVDIDNDDFRISGIASGAYGAGTNLSQLINTITIQGTSYPVHSYWGLDPNNTTWGSGSTLPVVGVLNRDNYQWDVGAYVYVPTGAETYYVTETGNGTDPDCSGGGAPNCAGAWDVADFNSSANWSTTDDINKIDPGDTVYFSGTITSQIQPAGSGTSGNVITLDGYYAGSADPINDCNDTGTCGGSTASTVLLSGSTAGIRIATGQDYLIIQDFRATGGPTGSALYNIYNSTTSDSADHITFQRNYGYAANLKLFMSTNLYGGEGTYASAKYLTLVGNKMTGYGKTTDPNQGLNFVKVEDSVLYGNDFGGDAGSSTCTSCNTIEYHAMTRSLVQNNYIHDTYNQAGIAIKEIGALYNEDVVVKFNKFYRNGYTPADNGRGISLTINAGYYNRNIYIHGNYVYGGGDFGIDIHRGNKYVYVWGNILADNDRNGIILWTAGGYVAEDNIYLYNNTAYANETDDTGSTEEDRTGIGIRETAATNIYIKNNILQDNRPNATSYQQWASHSTITSGNSDYNTLHYTGQTASYYYDGGIKTLVQMQGAPYYLDINSNITDPGLTDPSNGDFTLSAPGEAGTDVSQCFSVTVQGSSVSDLCTYYLLDPNNTDWTTTLPTVAVLDTRSYGWVRGAYVYNARDTIYITQTGAGAMNGHDFANAWPVSYFNNTSYWSTDAADDDKIGPGDTLYFQGTITTTLTFPTESSGSVPVYSGTTDNWITLDGWEGGTCNPVANLGCPQAAELDVVSTEECIYIHGNSWIRIQDFNMHDSKSGILSVGPQYGDDATHLMVRRNYFHDLNNKAVQLTQYSGSPYLWNGHNYTTFGGALGDGNYVSHVNTDCDSSYCEEGYSHDAGFAGGDDLVVSYNYITRNPAYVYPDGGLNSLSIHSGSRALVEYNTLEYPNGQTCLSVKEQGGSDKVIRFNKMVGGGDTAGISISSAYYPNLNIYAYGNFIQKSAAGMRVFKYADEVYFWANIMTDGEPEAGHTSVRGMYTIPRAEDDIGDLYWFNNTISRWNTSGNGNEPTSTGLFIYGDSILNVRVNNNILYYNNSGETYHTQLSVLAGSEVYLTSLKNNTIYSSSSAYIFYDDDYRDVTYINAQEANYSNNTEENPNFTDPNGADNTFGTYDDDYSLQASSPDSVKTGGFDVSQCFSVTIQGSSVPNLCTYYLLDPNNTDFTTIPPTIGLLDARDYAWPRGAYIYTTAGTSAPQNTNISSSPVTCPNGQDGNIQISFIVQTDINAYGRISTSNESWDTMGAGKAMTSGEGTKTHTETLTSLACDQTVTRYVATSTQSDNNGYESSTLQINITINAEEPASPPTPGAPTRVYINSSATGSKARVYLKDDTSGNARVVGVH